MPVPSKKHTVNDFRRSDFSDFGGPVRLRRPVCLLSGRLVAEGTFQIAIEPVESGEAFASKTGVELDKCQLSTRMFALDPRPDDDVVLREAMSGLPLVVRRGEDVIVCFDVAATRAYYISDSKRPIYTYIPGFNIHKVPAGIRRPLSNMLKSLQAPPDVDVVEKYAKLPLTSFEAIAMFIDGLLGGAAETGRPFHWPAGKRAAFVALHDVDTGGLLRRRQRDGLFMLEEKHQIKSTWFVPTGLLRQDRSVLDFLVQSGHEVGWHGHNHDHRLPFKPFADQRVQILKKSYFASPDNYPAGMRTPRLLKSRYLYELLERECPALRYDTSVLHGIVPYYLWLNGRPSTILEIPTTVPTDILVYNQLRGVPAAARAEAILAAQISRTNRLLDAGGLISIVTHPETDLSERPDFLQVYDEYLAFIRSQPDVWFTTAGELYKYWTLSDVPRSQVDEPA
jgi:peptidoglycan/xylan/chitin deacetylase (PgdA/CDA1 family)